MKWMKRNFITILLVILFLVGLGLLLYPTLSDYWNSFHQSRAIAGYAETVANINDDKYRNMLDDAAVYNQELEKTGIQWSMSEQDARRYDALLNVTGTGIMSYIEIPSINCSLPIYHSTDEAVLQIAVGHIAGTSLPVGGEGTHCVLSGHRGLPSAKLFTNLDQLTEGDVFLIRTLDELLTYEVDQIRIVLPSDLTELQIIPGQDLCTLVTCTPYGINTHRLLVRGHRIENAADATEIRVTADALQIDELVVAPIVAAPMLLILLVILLVSTRKRRMA